VFGLRWRSARAPRLTLADAAGRSYEAKCRVVFSLGGPFAVEVWQAIPGTPLDMPPTGGVHHVGYWVDDIAADWPRSKEVSGARIPGLQLTQRGLDAGGVLPQAPEQFQTVRLGGIDMAVIECLGHHGGMLGHRRQLPPPAVAQLALNQHDRLRTGRNEMSVFIERVALVLIAILCLSPMKSAFAGRAWLNAWEGR
jgi:hypothetical protein